jgi:thiol-disulfide isomerase/thioredoxin
MSTPRRETILPNASACFLLWAVAHASFSQSAEVVKLDRLRALMNPPADRIQVINFWATWCAPCVKELPFFEAYHAKREPGTAVALVNVDFVEKLDKVNAFVRRKKLTAPVLLLDEIDHNSWIDQVDKSWSGAIPATLIINGKTGARKFIERELSENELDQLINSIR